MLLTSKQIRDYATQQAILFSIGMCALKAASEVATPTGPVAKLIARMNGNPEDDSWMKIFAYYLIVKYQDPAEMDWATYETDLADNEDTVEAWCEDAIDYLAPIIYPASQTAILRTSFTGATANDTQVLYDAWRTANPTFVPIERTDLMGNDGVAVLMVEYIIS